MSRKEVSVPERVGPGLQPGVVSEARGPAAGDGMVAGSGCGAAESVGMPSACVCLILPGWRHIHQRTLSCGRRWRP